MGSDPEDSTWMDRGRLRAVRLESQALRQTSQQAIARARATRHLARYRRSERQLLHVSAYARLIARQETMAVIEQAKGIVMAQQRCGPEEAFDLLRRASQRANIKVRDLAAQIVEHVASSGSRGNVTPITLGAVRGRGGGTTSRTGTGRS